jgi:Caspase domain
MSTSYQKSAVIFGSDYYGQNALKGCINDANDIKKFLLRERGFDASNVTTLYNNKMTRKAMLQALDELAARTHIVAKQNKKPAVFFYYSGHGVQVPDTRGIESEGMAEAIVPYDFAKSELIKDYELFERFIQKLNAQTELFIFTDCCNSGTNFNLAYNGLARAYRANEVDADVIGLSGCSDEQTSAEVSGHGLATALFLKVMKTPEQVATMDAFRQAMADVSINGHRQTPQVSVSNAGLVKGSLYHWLLEDDETPQIPKRELQRLLKREKPSFLCEWLRKINSRK